MGRIQFDDDGGLSAVDGAELDKSKFKSVAVETVISGYEGPVEDGWNLCDNNQSFEPLKFSNGKTQEDIVREVVDLVKRGNKIIFIHGTCGTGKSAIALNIARQLGKTAIVVPVKSLQRQYEEDYKGKKYLLKKDGKRMKISMITGRENHDSVLFPGVSCADTLLPDTIQISEKNTNKLKDYYRQNPFISSKADMSEIKTLKRISIAPANPYWSPIASASYELKQLKDATKKKYIGMEGKEFIFYHRKSGCGYYDQYQAYIDADVIIFNAAKYKIETALGRKPQTEVDIIDEGDEFLDSLTNQEEINITRLIRSLQQVFPEDLISIDAKDKIVELLKLEEKNKQAIGINEGDLFHISDTKLEKALRIFVDNKPLVSEISMDDANYSNKAVEVALQFKDFIGDTYVTFRKHEDNLYASLATVNISSLFKDIVDKNKAIVFMSGTIHSPNVLKHIFGIEKFKVVVAEDTHQGVLEIHRTGKEFDCKHANFSSGNYSRKDYLRALAACVERAKKPALVHVNAFSDLPSEAELSELGIVSLMSREKLLEMQREDKTGKQVSMFKRKQLPLLFTTKCSRGIDFPGDMCNSVIFTKYTYPNNKDTFWRILEQTRKDYYWDFYKDKARREFLQRAYRALRSKDDHVFVLSPDLRVLDAARQLQMEAGRQK